MSYNFEYFYGTEAEHFIFFRIPKVLITDSRFKIMSTDSKLLYGLKKLFSGEDALTRRYDIIGELKPEHYPEWLKEKIKENPSLLKVKKHKEVER